MGLFKMLRGKASHHHNHLKSKAEERSLVVDENPPSDEAVGWVVPSHDKQHADYTHTEASATGFQTTVLREAIIAHATKAFAFALYGWTLPLLVPVFAIVKSVAGATPVWVVEEWLLSWHTNDLRLFAHLRHAYARRAVSLRLHAGAAGVALLALVVLVLRAPADSWLLRCTYLVASTLMALCGAKLVPTMRAGRGGKWWTNVQYQLLLAYNLAWLAGPSRARHFADHLALWLLLCAGVGERFYVLFFTPAWPAYDCQFAVATKCSWVLGVLSATCSLCDA